MIKLKVIRAASPSQFDYMKRSFRPNVRQDKEVLQSLTAPYSRACGIYQLITEDLRFSRDHINDVRSFIAVGVGQRFFITSVFRQRGRRAAMRNLPDNRRNEVSKLHVGRPANLAGTSPARTLVYTTAILRARSETAETRLATWLIVSSVNVKDEGSYSPVSHKRSATGQGTLRKPGR